MKINPIVWSSIQAEDMSPLVTRQYVSGEQITLARFELKKGSVIPEHKHANEQISSIISGSLVFHMDSREIIVHAGEFLVIPPHVPHGAEAREDCIAIDVFSPPRADWAAKQDGYLRQK
ncbi:MAG TPA: cupin domain-containing protein [Terriglobales bacterium]|nr:cupin domain-containing protein [Terriglobales bacterium]